MKKQPHIRFSLTTASWRRQLAIAFVLMTIIPLLTLGYFLTIYGIPHVITRESLLLVVVLNLVLSLSGFMILRNIIKSLRHFRDYIKAIARDDLDQQLSVSDEAEIRRIAGWAQIIVEKLRQDRKQLKILSEQLEEKIENRTMELKATNEQLRNLAAHLESIREEERTRISRGIHDELGHALTGLKMDLSWLRKTIAKGGAATKETVLAEKIQSMTVLLDNTIQTVRSIASELRPGLLDHLGLAAAVEWQGQEFGKRTGIACDLTIPEEDITLNESQTTAIFRVFQEMLTNVARHAKATTVSVRLEKDAGNLTLEVQDNGRGITESQISDPRSLGFLGMQERVHLLGGKFAIQGREGEGTTVRVEIPVVASDQLSVIG